MIDDEVIKEQLDNLEGYINKVFKDLGITLEARRHHAGEQVKYCYERLIEKGAKPIPLSPYSPFLFKKSIIVAQDGRSIEETKGAVPRDHHWEFHRNYKKTRETIMEALKEYSEFIHNFSEIQSKLLNVLRK